MHERFVKKYDEPFEPEDIDICQKAFDAILKRLKVEKDSEEAERAAAIVIELYRQGARQESQLIELAAAARGSIVIETSREIPSSR